MEASASVPTPPNASGNPAPPAREGGFLLAALSRQVTETSSVDEIIGLKNRGIDGQYIAGMAKAGWGRITAALIEIQARESARIPAIRPGGPAPRELTEGRSQPRAVRRPPEATSPNPRARLWTLTAAEAIELQTNGVRPELFQAFQEAGWKNLSVRDVVDAQQVGVHAGTLREARQYGSNLTLKQIVRLKQAGVI